MEHQEKWNNLLIYTIMLGIGTVIRILAGDGPYEKYALLVEKKEKELGL